MLTVLYNGRKQEFDISSVQSWRQILGGIESRQAYVGQVHGDFEIASVDYDWGLRQQKNTARCVRCGEEKLIPNLRDFARGKGAALYCKCRYKKTEHTPVPVKETYRSMIGRQIGDFSLIDYQIGKGFRVECLVCGKQKWATGKATLEKRMACNHKITNDYSDPKYDGSSVGSLTMMGREGKLFRFRCDCGKEVVRAPSSVFCIDGAKSCGDPACIHHRLALVGGNDKRVRGLLFEYECAAEIEKQGYLVEMTPGTGDYGVDFFAEIDGDRVAFQCKRTKVESMIGAVQEVYAGGRYYDCSRFVVVSPSGFTYSAEIMARKLGVQLEKNLHNFQLKTLGKNLIETQRITSYSGRKLMWEIDGVVKSAEEWCAEYGITRSAVVSRMKRGLDLKSALTKPKFQRDLIEINGVMKRKQYWCDEYGISPQLFDYRVKYSGLSSLEALTKPKHSPHSHNKFE